MTTASRGHRSDKVGVPPFRFYRCGTVHRSTDVAGPWVCVSVHVCALRRCIYMARAMVSFGWWTFWWGVNSLGDFITVAAITQEHRTYAQVITSWHKFGVRLGGGLCLGWRFGPRNLAVMAGHWWYHHGRESWYIGLGYAGAWLSNLSYRHIAHGFRVSPWSQGLLWDPLNGQFYDPDPPEESSSSSSSSSSD